MMASVDAEAIPKEELKVEAEAALPPPSAEDAEPPSDGTKEAALAALAKLKEKVKAENREGAANGADTAAADEPPARPRKKRFGPPANAPREAPKPRKRKSRWASDEDSKALIINNGPRWPTDVTLPGGITVVLPAWLTGRKMSDDPAIQAVYDQLWDMENKLREGTVDMPPEHERSPSPPPVYDRFGVRQNTREARYRDKMLDRRCDLIEELIKVDKSYMPPSDYRPRRKHRKIFIPIKEFPGYNFIGLIIGPRGNTQKRMQAETNTKIAIRGRGSVKEGAARDPKYDYGEDEDLHVLITGDTQEDVDNAAVMIEDLLQPLDETRNEHKRLQLRELAALNGTIKDDVPEDQLAVIAGDKQADDVYQLPSQIQTAAQEQYVRDIARVHGHQVQTQEQEYQDFFKSLGGGPPGMGGERDRPGLGMPRGGGRHDRPGDDLPDDCKLYVAGLSPVFDGEELRQMFSHFGNVLHAAVIKEPGTSRSRGFGFVHYPDTATARAAAEGMNGKVIDDRTLIVKLRCERYGPRGEGGGGGPQFGYDAAKLYVSHLPDYASEHEIRALFEGVAPVTEAHLITEKMTGQSRGYAFVTMINPEAAHVAMGRLDGYKWGERSISVRPAGEKRGGAGGPGPGPGLGAPPPMYRPPYQPGPPGAPFGAPSGPPGYHGGPPGYGPPGGMPPPPGPYQAYQQGAPPYGGPPPGQPPHGYGPHMQHYPPGAPGPSPHGYGPPGAQPPGYSMPPPPNGQYGAPYGTPYGAAPSPPYAAPPPDGSYDAAAGAAPGPPLPGQPPLSQPPPLPSQPMPGQPPLPPSGAPPLPPGDPPLPSEPPSQVQDEYAKFMSELTQS